MLCIILGVRNTNYWSDQCARHRLLWSPRSLSLVCPVRPRLLHVTHCHQTSEETEERDESEAHMSGQCQLNLITSD